MMQLSAIFQLELGKEAVAAVKAEAEASKKKWSLDEDEESDEESTAAAHKTDGSDLAVKLEKMKGEAAKGIPLPPVKKEEVKKEEEEEEDDDVDPLDAYMTEVSKEVRKIKGASFKAAKGIVTKVSNKEEKTNGVNGGGESGGEKKGLVIMMGVAKKKPEMNIKKPEVSKTKFSFIL